MRLGNCGCAYNDMPSPGFNPGWVRVCKAHIGERNIVQPVAPKPRQRNPEATCKTCPYFHVEDQHAVFGDCRIVHNTTSHELDHWCGEHPNFFMDQEGR